MSKEIIKSFETIVREFIQNADGDGKLNCKEIIEYFEKGIFANAFRLKEKNLELGSASENSGVKMRKDWIALMQFLMIVGFKRMYTDSADENSTTLLTKFQNFDFVKHFRSVAQEEDLNGLNRYFY